MILFFSGDWEPLLHLFHVFVSCVRNEEKIFFNLELFDAKNQHLAKIYYDVLFSCLLLEPGVEMVQYISQSCSISLQLRR